MGTRTIRFPAAVDLRPKFSIIRSSISRLETLLGHRNGQRNWLSPWRQQIFGRRSSMGLSTFAGAKCRVHPILLPKDSTPSDPPRLNLSRLSFVWMQSKAGDYSAKSVRLTESVSNSFHR